MPWICRSAVSTLFKYDIFLEHLEIDLDQNGNLQKSQIVRMEMPGIEPEAFHIQSENRRFYKASISYNSLVWIARKISRSLNNLFHVKHGT